MNFLYHSLQIYVVANAIICTNLFYLIFVTSALGQYDALKILLNELDILSKQNDDGCNNQKIKQHIKEISSIHVELIKYLIYALTQ